MSETGNGYTQKAVPLAGGMDLKTPRMLVEPGRLVDVLNYECTDTDGYKKMDGFERYDGGPTVSVSAFLTIQTNFDISDPGFYLEKGDVCRIDYTDQNAVEHTTYATVAGIGSKSSTFTVIFFPTSATNIIGSASATIHDVAPASPTEDVDYFANVVSGVIVAWYGDETDGRTLGNAISTADSDRSSVYALPLDAQVYGMQYYKEQLHVVADCYWMYLAFDTGTSPGVTAREFYVGNTFQIGAVEGIIKDFKFLRGGFGGLGSTAADRAWVKVLVHITTPGTPTTNTTCSIDIEHSPFSAADVSCWKYYSSIDVDGPTDSTDVWGGVLYKGLVDESARDADTNSWTQIDMGYEVAFEDGDSDIEPKELTLATTLAQLNNEPQSQTVSPTNAADCYSQGTMYSYDNSATNLPPGPPDPNVLLDITGAFDLSTADTTGVHLVCTTEIYGDGTANTFKNLGLTIPEDVIITGIQVVARCFLRTATANAKCAFTTVKLTLPGSYNKGSTALELTTALSAAATTFTFGSATDRWGVTSITPADLNDPEFGITMTPVARTTGGTHYLCWDLFTVEVSYFRPIGKVFFYDGTDEVEAKLVRVALTGGSWTDTTGSDPAKGVMHVYDLVANNTRNYIKATDQIRLVSGGTTIATATSVAGSFLPSFTDTVASDRRFQILRSNFYLNPDWESLYGVNGLGRAFSYDGTYFRKIYTEYGTDIDKPAHIAAYRNYLVLGYPSGNLLLSAITGDVGPQPEEFRALKGAREFSFGDRIHGLLELADTSLGVFGKSTIQRLVLNTQATSPDSLFYQAMISQYSGAIEYTVAGFGDLTLYCDQYGVRTVNQTDVYGDLIAVPLSAPVGPWLRPRLSSKKYWKDGRSAQKPVFAHTIKAKNQYRVWFDDGYVLCMNMNGRDAQPQFTLLRYGFDFGGNFVPLIPTAFAHSTDDTVTERLFISHWNRTYDSDTAENDPDYFKYVFELEKGWSFDGEDFPCRLTINLSLLDSPFNYDNIRKVELHGLDYNNTTLFAGFGTKYSEELVYSGLSMGDTYTPAGRNTAGTIPTDYTPFCKMIQCGSRGRPLMLKLKNSTTSTGGDADSVIEPPHILQAALLHYNPGRNEV